MNQTIAKVALTVHDYDEAIGFYVGKLNFKLIEDTWINDNKRWVVVKPEGEGSAALLLAKAVGEEQLQTVGRQSGGRVFLFLETDNLERDYQHLRHMGVTIVRKPVTEPYGKVAVFADIYGNLWDLIEPVKE